MNYYTIDFTGVTDLSDFYQRIIKGLKFPDWCGENLDAIWDMLTGYMVAPAHITSIGSEKLSNILEYEFSFIKKVFDRTIEWYKDIDEEVIVVYK